MPPQPRRLPISNLRGWERSNLQIGTYKIGRASSAATTVGCSCRACFANFLQKMKDIKAKILSNINIGSNYYKMSLETPYIAKAAKPGQFVMVKCSNGYEPLLRRPFSIHRVKGQGSRVKGIEILYEVIGKGTEILSEKKKGEFLDVLGPLGNGFTFSSLVYRPFRLRQDFGGQASIVFLIAGGIGVAPLIFLAEKLASSKPIVLIGAKTKKLILCEKDFKKIGAEVHVATDDGSYGYKGFISELFKDMLRRTRDACPSKPWRRRKGRRTIYACGPEPMLKAVSDICNKEKIPCEVSLETKMACGFGACLGCAIKLKGESSYKLACKDGPVFNADEIIW